MEIIGFVMLLCDVILIGAAIYNKQKELSQKGIKFVLASAIGLIISSMISAFYLMEG